MTEWPNDCALVNGESFVGSTDTSRVPLLRCACSYSRADVWNVALEWVIDPHQVLTRHSRNICWSDSRMSTTTIYYWKPNDVLLLPLPLPLPVDCWGHGHQGYLHRHQSINQSILFMRHLCLSIHLLIPLLYLSTYPALCPLPSALCLHIQPSSSHTNETSIQFPNNCRSTDKAGGWLGTVLLNS